MTRRVYVRRRYAVLLLLMVLSGLYWAGTWAWIMAADAERAATGAHEITRTLHAAGEVYEATWTWVGAVVVVHLLAAAVAWRRDDREALAGTAWSVLFHLVFMVTWGVLRPV